MVAVLRRVRGHHESLRWRAARQAHRHAAPGTVASDNLLSVATVACGLVTAQLSTRRVPSLIAVVAAGSVITAVSLGVRSTFGLFLDPVTDTFGTDRGMFALAIAIQNLVWGISQPVAGAVADRFGSARVLVVGAVVYASGIVLMANADSESAFVLSAGFIVGIGLGAASFSVVLAAIGRIAPVEKRSLALGVATAMGSVGQFVLVPVTQRLLDGGDWRDILPVLAGAALLVVAFAPVLRGRAADQASPTDGPARPLRHELRRAAHSRSYVLLNAGFFVCGFHVTFIATHLPSYADDLGQGGSTAANALALVGLFNIVGSLAAGYLGGTHSKTRLLSGIYAARAVVIAAFVLVPASAATTLVFGAAMGVLWLSTVPLTSGIVTSQFGTAHAGSLFGIVFLSHQFGAFAGAWMGGELADAVGSYDPVWWVAVSLGIFSAVIHFFVDEGPVPEPPPPGVGIRLRPAGGIAALMVLLGSAGAVASTARAAGATAEERAMPVLLCTTGPAAAVHDEVAGAEP